MQPPYSVVPHSLSAIESTISPARLHRYLPSTSVDKNLALRTYVWNARLCEALYLPVQIAEITIRNAIFKAVEKHYGSACFNNTAFIQNLPDRLRRELEATKKKEQKTYGSKTTNNHIISGLSFGFWVQLLTKKFDNHLWPQHFPTSFPQLPPGVTREALHTKANDLRLFRNRIAHHKPVFDRSPSKEFNSLLELTGWVCEETKWLIKQTNRVSRTINQRPKVHIP